MHKKFNIVAAFLKEIQHCYRFSKEIQAISSYFLRKHRQIGLKTLIFLTFSDIFRTFPSFFEHFSHIVFIFPTFFEHCYEKLNIFRTFIPPVKLIFVDHLYTSSNKDSLQRYVQLHSGRNVIVQALLLLTNSTTKVYFLATILMDQSYSLVVHISIA